MNVTLVDAWTSPSASRFFRNVFPMYLHEISGYDIHFYSLDETGCWQPDLIADWLAPVTPAANLRSPPLPDHGSQPYQRTQVIISDGRPVGFACLGLPPFRFMPDDVDACIAEFFVIHESRGAGIGHRALELLLPRHHGRWHLRAIHDNERAIRFWAHALQKSGVRDLERRNEEGDVVWRFKLR
jgi:predicted acetyltransferase